MTDIIPSERRWRLINRPRLKVQFQFEPRDVWVGLFWRVTHHYKVGIAIVHLYICLLPLLPIHVSVLRERPSDG